uniref:Uncharacterized protein n=1 Tax=Rhizophagus irregularis (strain DAOM 181602 / DAOM 197198 / MUCL 43194) TaxID=747089 RepID=U9TSF3_RHIID
MWVGSVGLCGLGVSVFSRLVLFLLENASNMSWKDEVGKELGLRLGSFSLCLPLCMWVWSVGLCGRTNFEAMDSPMDSKVQNDKQVEDFNKLNSDFSERIKDINGNAQETKVKVRKEVESDNKELNENNKRITVYQGSILIKNLLY